MKMLIAYFRPDNLNAVKEALYKEEINRFTILDSFGHSEEDGNLESYRGIEIQVDLIPKIKLEIALNDNFVDRAVNAIKHACRSGKVGDGKIFVIPIEKAYRIRSDDEDSVAIG